MEIHICFQAVGGLYSCGPWADVRDLYDHPSVGQFAQQVINVVQSSRAPSTLNKNELYFKKFVKWCSDANLVSLPASPSPSTVSLFIYYLVSEKSFRIGIKFLFLCY